MPRKKSALRFVTPFATYTAGPSDILGRGGSGTVYRALDDAGSAVAIKVPDPVKATRDKTRRFKNEILFGAQSRHRSVMQVLDYGSIVIDGRDTSFYVMPLYGSTLRQLITDHIPAGRVLPLFSSLLDGVEAAHLKKVVHRDLKPENVFYNGTEQVLVVGDFGVAHFDDEDRFTAVETKPGTRLANFQYAAPEQRVRGSNVDQRSDIYALGLMLNEMFTGSVPHGTGYELVESVVPNYAFVDELIAIMIRQSPRDRPGDVDSIKQRLIAAEQEFVTRQKLHALENTVVAASTIDDPLIADPIRVVGFEVAGANSVSLKLNRAPSAKWRDVAQNLRASYSYPMGHDPKAVPIYGEIARIVASDSDMQRVIDSFKEFLSLVNRRYPEELTREAMQRDREEQRRREAAIQEERRRLDLQTSLKI